MHSVFGCYSGVWNQDQLQVMVDDAVDPPPPLPLISLKPCMNLHPAACPSLLLMDVGMITSIPSKDPCLPLPSPEGCGRLIITWQRIWGMRNTRGGQEVGGPHGASRKQAMTYVCHGLFPLIFCTSNKLKSGNTNFALAVFSCLWESLIVSAKDWLHV